MVRATCQYLLSVLENNVREPELSRYFLKPSSLSIKNGVSCVSVYQPVNHNDFITAGQTSV